MIRVRIRSRVYGLALASLVAISLGAHASAPDRQFVRVKNDPVISPWAAQVIQGTEKSGRVKVWVFFTDKGFFDDRGMRAVAAQKSVAISAHAAARRAKVGRDQVSMLDLPVRDVYVDRVRDVGATLRRASRWLNAASFEVDVAMLDSIARMPFVTEIRPMIGMRRAPDPIDSEPGDLMDGAKSAMDPLNYGASQAQLQQINVPAAHTAGYHGEGVRVCMMDTGYRKDHVVFGSAFTENRVIAEYDFIFDDGDTQNEPEDNSGQHGHGTLTWSTLGGELDGTHYGPAFEAEFLLAKTEDVRSETQIEEDNWVAGMEWSEGLGADVISSSLGYSDWYVSANYNGDFCVTTKAADSATALGIVVCNSAGNGGPGASTLGAPADADSILTVGAVNSSGTITSFSSRGPTADGRIKPEVCARGSSTACATSSTTTSFGSANGTSLSCPLVGGAAALVIQAQPTWTPAQVREALMMTASQHCTPNNNYGWGIIDVMAAITYNPCAEVCTPSAPSTGNPEPCPDEEYTISWGPKLDATGYELYENGILIYQGPLSQVGIANASGSYSYRVKATDACGTSPLGPVGGSTTVGFAPATPNPPSTSNSTPCGTVNYNVSWDSVDGALAYYLFENDSLIYFGSNLTIVRNHPSGTYDYYVVALESCPSPPSATGATTSVSDCQCHGDPVCDGVTTVLDVTEVINEAFRSTAGTVDPACAHVSRSDVTCDCAVTILDVIHVINVAFRGADEAVEFCNACTDQCP